MEGSVRFTDSTPARIGVVAWLLVPAMWSISILLERTREFEGSPQAFWFLGAASLIVASAMTGYLALKTTEPVRSGRTKIGLGLLSMGMLVSVVAAWAIPIWTGLYAAGLLLVGMASGNRSALFMGTALAIATVSFFVITALKVGTPDEFGDYPAAWAIATYVATVGAALGMAIWPAAIRTEKSRAPIPI